MKHAEGIQPLIFTNVTLICDFFKRGEVHFFVAAEGNAFVLGNAMETLATWFTADMRDTLVLALGMGGRSNPARSSATKVASARTDQYSLLCFIFGASDALAAVRKALFNSTRSTPR